MDGCKQTLTRPQGRAACAVGGFTLIELIVVIAIAAILIGIAAPSFSRMIANQRAKAVGSELFLALSKARSEAITRNQSVTLSPKSGDWTNGWQILDPADASRVLEDRGATTAATLTQPATGVIYQPSGRLRSALTEAFLVTVADSDGFCIDVDPAGRPYMKVAGKVAPKCR